MTFVEQEFSSRKVSLPAPLESPEGVTEKVQIPQVEASEDVATDLQACLDLVGDLETLIDAANSAAISKARSEWNSKHSFSVEPGSAIDVIRSQVGTYTNMGMDEETAVRAVVSLPHVFAACLIDGIDPKPALTDEQFNALSEKADEFKAVVIAQREKLAAEKAKRDASGKKRGRPAKSE